MGLLQVDAENAGCALQAGDESEIGPDPLAPLAFFEEELPVAEIEAGSGEIGVNVGDEIHAGGGAIFAEAVGGAFDAKRGAAIRDVDTADLAARDILAGLGGVVGKEGERAVGARQIGSAHAGKRLGFAIRGREVGGHADHAGGHALFGEQLPEGAAGTQAVHAAGRERDHVGADSEACEPAR